PVGTWRDFKREELEEMHRLIGDSSKTY
ncbi:MAG: 23S rRNA pseudouridine synthase F, partial [Flavobacteriales bacterium]